jgi:hypothetical protein
MSASIVLADDFKTIEGKEYKNAKVSRVEPDGITIKFSGGIVKIPFPELPPDVQKKYGYDPKAVARQSAGATPANTQATEPVATSGIEGLSPITVELKDEILNALKMHGQTRCAV